MKTPTLFDSTIALYLLQMALELFIYSCTFFNICDKIYVFSRFLKSKDLILNIIIVILCRNE